MKDRRWIMTCSPCGWRSTSNTKAKTQDRCRGHLKWTDKPHDVMILSPDGQEIHYTGQKL